MAIFNTIQATVLAKNSESQFICNPCGGYGQTLPIPCGDNAQVNADYWAVPVKDEYFRGFRLTINTAGIAAPTFDSIACFKLTNMITSDYYIVVGRGQDYSAACAACCATSPAPTLVATLVDIASCQDTCTADGTNYDAFFAVETLADVPAGKYVSKVSLNGVLINQQTFGTGSTSIAALVTYLNANAASGGTWSNTVSNTIRFRTTLAVNICFIGCIKTS